MCWCAVGCGGWQDRGLRWRIRPFVPAADREWVQRLWATAMPPSWPLPPAGIAMLADGLVAEAGTGPVGLAAIDRAGSVPLILMHPEYQGHGIGTGLLAAALDALRARGPRGEGRQRGRLLHLAWDPAGSARRCHVLLRAGLAAQLRHPRPGRGSGCFRRAAPVPHTGRGQASLGPRSAERWPAHAAGQSARNRYPNPRTVSITDERGPSFLRSECTTASMTLDATLAS